MEDGEFRQKWMGLVEIENGQLLYSPLSKAIKTKYTCIAASSSHVILGANTGSLYCFTAKGFKYVRLLANVEGPVSLVKFSPDEKTLAVVVGGYNVCFWEINLHEQNAESKRFHVSNILKGGVITEVLWDGDTRLFYGDNQGRVVIAFVPKISRKFGSSSIFKRVDEIIHLEKSPIVQLDIHKDTLLVSSYQRCCLLKLTGEMIVGSITRVGTRPRDGPYGAVFHPRVTGRPPVVYSARQGGRMWEADVAGTVLSTVRHKDSITMAPSNILSLSAPFLPSPLSLHTISNLNFSRLVLIFNTYLLAWQKDSMFLFHPSSYSLCLWTNVLKGIVQVENVNEKLYVLHENCQRITCVTFTGMTEVLQALVSANNPPLTNEFLVMYSEDIMAESLKTEIGRKVVSSVVRNIREAGLEMSPQLDNLLELLPKEREQKQEEVKDKDESAKNGQEREQEKEEYVEETDGIELFVPVSPRHNEEEQKDRPVLEQKGGAVLEQMGGAVLEQKGGAVLEQKGGAVLEQKGGAVLEQKVLDAIFKVEESVARSKVKEAAAEVVMVTEDEGLFQMEDSTIKENDANLESKSFTEQNGLSLSEEKIASMSDQQVPPCLSSASSSLTTPTIAQDPISNGYSLPNSSDYSPQISSIKLGSSPSLPLSPPTSFISPAQVDQPPLSVRMGGKVSEENDEISVIGVVRSKKKRKGTKKKKKPSKPQQDLDDIFESSLPVDISPVASQLSSTNPSEENSRASSPQRAESQNSIMSSEFEKRMSLPVDSEVSLPGQPAQRSMSLDFPSSEPFQPVLSKRQSIDIELDLSRLGIQKPSAILSKVKSMASSQQEKTGRKVKELLSSLSPTPTTSSSSNTLSSFYSTTPIASAVSPPPSDTIIGVTSPSPEVGLLPVYGHEETGCSSDCQLVSHNPPTAVSGNGDFNSPISVTPEPSLVIDSETEKFISSTSIAMAAVDNPLTLSSPSQFRQALQQWREELSSYHTHLSCLVSDSEGVNNRGYVFLLPPYTKLSPVLHKHVSELTSLMVQNVLPLDDLPKFIGSYKALLNISQIKGYIGTLSVELIRQCWNQLLCGDEYLGNLVPSSDLAVPSDSLNRIKEFIRKYPLSGPAFMQRVFYSDTSKFLELCLTLADVSPWEVVMATCPIHKDVSDSSTQSTNEEEGLKVFGEYLNRLISSEASTVKSRQNRLDCLLKGNNDLLLLSIRACLATLPNQTLVGNNQRPLPYSHTVQWPHQAGLTRLTRLSSLMSRDTIEQVIDIFNDRGYWNGLFHLLIQTAKVEKLFSLTTDLRDPNLLKRINQSGLLNAADRWKLLLETSVSHGVPLTSEDTSNELTIESVIKAMVGEVGVEEACQVLNRVEGLQGSELPCSLQQFLISAAALHREKRSVAHVLLEKLDRHLWAARPPALGPQLLAVYKTKNAEPLITAPTSVISPSSLEIRIEDTSSHWGICGDSERCGVCRHPVSSAISDKEPGSLAFNCGHFYHRQCLPEQACVLCFVKKYSVFFENSKQDL